MSTTASAGTQARSAEELEQLYVEFFTPYNGAAKPKASEAGFVEATFYDYSVISVVDESSAS